ncbi:MAG: hypothetical protein JWO47_1021 [Candidatus Saccharibacteria bacterium]|nr:hypothetical protein [Candidatus Saccharibacteria bacterium]
MALFNRKKPSPTVLPEIDKYYNAEKKERMGLAWILAVISIACVALILIGGFFGGRWVYRKVNNKKTGVATITAPASKITQQKTTSTDTPDSSPQTPSTPSSTPAQTAPVKTPTNSTPTPAPATTPPTVPSSVVSPTKLANTGPGSTLAVFIISALGFAGLHNFFIRRTSKN